MSKKVFLTGGSGFVGKVIIELLVEKGYHVVALSRSDSSDKEIARVGGTPVRCSMSDESSLMEHIKGCFSVIHCAAKLETNASSIDELFRDNVDATKTLYNVSCFQNVRVFVFISTEGVIMNGNNIRDAPEHVPSLDHINHLGWYNQSKAIAERYLLGYIDNENNNNNNTNNTNNTNTNNTKIKNNFKDDNNENNTNNNNNNGILNNVNKKTTTTNNNNNTSSTSSSKTKSIIIRLPLIWGKGDNVLKHLCNLANTLRWVWIGGGRNQLSICHVKNAAHGIILAMEKGDNGDIYHLTDGPSVQFRSFFTERFQKCRVSDWKLHMSLPIPFAWLLVYVMSFMWRIFSLKGLPLLTKTGLYYSSKDFTINDQNARLKLGYQPIITYEQGMAQIAKEMTPKQSQSHSQE
ncbi:hypothetical protein DFA_06128 [Cavenderia fasciculata]|uniref:NAD-dependent epimerase/dehydratase domain-containing protein n=1 Tax=Cavenderia fasciculata TaxID=261658 RepID=F4PK66_CACFS|nr:uncharacterized protein DFA_06128 [Cavenderia fasciculata]EGG23990.1 hypothetical protein DFA_06128 [Cavenderia fasciculata]|eukprot:XP_004361841.1 hypothetical protein DFA_06128 [Cavenderia fasciculata]